VNAQNDRSAFGEQIGDLEAIAKRLGKNPRVLFGAGANVKAMEYEEQPRSTIGCLGLRFKAQDSRFSQTCDPRAAA